MITTHSVMMGFFLGASNASEPVTDTDIFIFSNELEEEDEMQKLIKPLSVTTSDTNPENAVMTDGTSAEYIFVGVAGAVAFILEDGTSWIAPTMTAGGWLWMPAFRGIKATGTAATGIFISRRR